MPGTPPAVRRQGGKEATGGCTSASQAEEGVDPGRLTLGEEVEALNGAVACGRTRRRARQDEGVRRRGGEQNGGEAQHMCMRVSMIGVSSGQD